MRRALTVLTLPILLLSGLDCVPSIRANMHLWSRLREKHREAPDTGWDRYYRQMVPYLPERGRVGLVQVAVAGTTARARENYFLQYALAPHLVMPGSDEEFVIAYGPPAAAGSLLDPAKFSLVRSFYDDFALYRRTRP
jgi:hypothetical protein